MPRHTALMCFLRLRFSAAARINCAGICEEAVFFFFCRSQTSATVFVYKLWRGGSLARADSLSLGAVLQDAGMDAIALFRLVEVRFLRKVPGISRPYLTVS